MNLCGRSLLMMADRVESVFQSVLDRKGEHSSPNRRLRKKPKKPKKPWIGKMNQKCLREFLWG